ncbi:MAG: PEP-CTERM sorting domain-containing protein [Kiritimatiellales bacterium]
MRTRRITAPEIAAWLFAAIVLVASEAQSANIAVSSVQTYIGGTNSAVPNSGTTDNFNTNTTHVGSTAVFNMTKDGTDFADLRVTYNGGAGTKVMVNRTSNSQGLTDTGTISILMDFASSTGYSGSFTFDWFSPNSFVGGSHVGGSLISDAILYTTFDIDYYQFVSTKTNQLQSYGLTSNTVLHTDLLETPSMIRFEDNNANSLVNEPTTAAQFLTQIGPASLQIDMGKQNATGASLFMFEFRDPSQIVTTPFVPVSIPEPATASMMALVAAIGFLIRRRFMA